MKKNLLLFLLLIAVLVGCAKPESDSKISQEDLFINGNKENVQVLKNKDNVNIEYKDKLFVVDKEDYETLKKSDNTLLLTFDNKIVKDYDPSKIEKYKEFASFYQVEMKDGTSLQMFDKPEVDFPPVKSDVSKGIVGIYKHGDHWHIKMEDGTEYISYEDPTEIAPDVEVKEYEGKDH